MERPFVQFYVKSAAGLLKAESDLAVTCFIKRILPKTCVSDIMR
jgi:hypothetical protein